MEPDGIEVGFATILIDGLQKGRGGHRIHLAVSGAGR
jgi:hypothetical protein